MNKTLLKNIIREEVVRQLNEVSGWALEEDDVDWVNTEDEGGKPYMVRIWPGSGYFLPAWGVYANSEEEALEKTVAYMEQNGDEDFFCDDYVEETIQELEEEGLDNEKIYEEINERFCYVDATMEGASQPHYVFWENLQIYPYDKSRFRNFRN